MPNLFIGWLRMANFIGLFNIGVSFGGYFRGYGSN